MSVLISCPLGSAIGEITIPSCPEHYFQIVRLAFRRISAGAFTDIGTEMEWDTHLAASDADKVQFTPIFENCVIPQGEEILEGEDSNESSFGLSKVVGKSNIRVTGRFDGLPAASKATLEPYMSEASFYNQMGVYLINEFGHIMGLGTAPALAPIPISAFFIGDAGSEGYNAHNYTPFGFSLKGGWADTLEIVTDADFDPLTKANS